MGGDGDGDALKAYATGVSGSDVGVSGSSVGVCVLALGVIGVLGDGDDIETGESSS